jgi:hypothetical protein
MKSVLLLPGCARIARSISSNCYRKSDDSCCARSVFWSMSGLSEGGSVWSSLTCKNCNINCSNISRYILTQHTDAQASRRTLQTEIPSEFEKFLEEMLGLNQFHSQIIGYNNSMQEYLTACLNIRFSFWICPHSQEASFVTSTELSNAPKVTSYATTREQLCIKRPMLGSGYNNHACNKGSTERL